MSAQKPFNWKSFVSLYLVFSFVVLGLSGIVLYIAPPGRIANWSIWRLVGFSKVQWQSVHTLFALVFLVAAGAHLYFNWKVLMAYVKSRVHEGMRMKRELASATAASFAVFVLTAAGVPPFSTVVEVGDDLKNSWTTPAIEPPIAHAEELTLEKLAESVKIPADAARANLAASGVVVGESGWTLQQIADANKMTPQEVYNLMQSEQTPAQVTPGLSGGWGTKTVEQVCAQSQVPVQTGLDRLTAAGIPAEATDTLKELADAARKTPTDIAGIITATVIEHAPPPAAK